MDISKSIQAGIESSQSLEAQRRKRLAYNALTKMYGPIAGDPDSAVKMQEYGYNEQANPLKLTGLGLDNEGKQLGNEGKRLNNAGQAQENDFRAQANPLKLQGLGLDNEASEQKISQSAEAFPLEQSKRRANIAQSYAAIANSNAHTQKTQQDMAFGAADRAALAGSYMVGAMIEARKKGASPQQLTQMFDRYAPSISKLDAVDPTQLGMIRHAVVTDPDNALPFLQQQLAGAGSQLDPQTAALLGATFLKTGQMPSLGQGKDGAHNRLLVARTAAQQAAEQGMTGADVADKRQTYKSRQAYLTDLAKSSPSSAGGLVRSASAVLAHMDILDSYIGALKNGDIRLANKLGQEFKKQTGKVAPTSFDAQRIIVADELSKFLIARGGTGEDRKKMLDSVDKAGSAAQLRDVISTWKHDMVGQLEAQRQQAEAFDATDQFNRQLTPAVRGMLSAHGAAPQPSVSADDAALLAKYGLK